MMNTQWSQSASIVPRVRNADSIVVGAERTNYTREAGKDGDQISHAASASLLEDEGQFGWNRDIDYSSSTTSMDLSEESCWR